MSQVYDVTAHSSAPPAAVYALLARGASWPLWSPIDELVQEGAAPSPPSGLDEALSAPEDAVGSIRAFRTGRNLSREVVTALVPDQLFGYDMLSGGGGMLRDYRGQVTLTPDGAGTNVRWSATFRVPVPLVGPLVARLLGRYMQRCVDGLAVGAAQVGRPLG